MTLIPTENSAVETTKKEEGLMIEETAIQRKIELLVDDYAYVWALRAKTMKSYNKSLASLSGQIDELYKQLENIGCDNQ